MTIGDLRAWLLTMLPVPPEGMRALIGRPELADFVEPPDYWEGQPTSVLDLGCGCGRLARWMLSTSRPERYVGIDIHAGMIEWCRVNLAAPGFEFIHQDVLSPRLNPSGSLHVAPFPDGNFDLVLAVSLFTHLLQDQAEFYLDEIARVLAPDGSFFSTWFLFDKIQFPMMQDFQNALFINPKDPTNAVIYDRTWLLSQLTDRRLVLHDARAPSLRGFQWYLSVRRAKGDAKHVEFPIDGAPPGRSPPPA